MASIEEAARFSDALKKSDEDDRKRKDATEGRRENDKAEEARRPLDYKSLFHRVEPGEQHRQQGVEQDAAHGDKADVDPAGSKPVTPTEESGPTPAKVPQPKVASIEEAARFSDALKQSDEDDRKRKDATEGRRENDKAEEARRPLDYKSLFHRVEPGEQHRQQGVEQDAAHGDKADRAAEILPRPPGARSTPVSQEGDKAPVNTADLFRGRMPLPPSGEIARPTAPAEPATTPSTAQAATAAPPSPEPMRGEGAAARSNTADQAARPAEQPMAGFWARARGET